MNEQLKEAIEYRDQLKKKYAEDPLLLAFYLPSAERLVELLSEDDEEDNAGGE